MDEDPVRKVAEWYDALAPSYDELYGQEQDLKHKIILERIGPSRVGTLLDVGCGTGRLLQQAENMYDVGIGIDVSRRMLLVAKHRRSSRTDLVQAVSSRLPFRQHIADCIVSVSTAKAGPNISELMAESARVGRKESMLAVIGFDQSVSTIDPTEARKRLSARINDRETLNVFTLNRSG
ncbi:MAG TPA: methyltransferase domain-containing protein [Candidatus Bathyarchaeia archaeon]|nr:methyltransferase domain-containing protein [Candidatus Bathyarchaeia archaeon]